LASVFKNTRPINPKFPDETKPMISMHLSHFVRIARGLPPITGLGPWFRPLGFYYALAFFQIIIFESTSADIFMNGVRWGFIIRKAFDLPGCLGAIPARTLCGGAPHVQPAPSVLVCVCVCGAGGLDATTSRAQGAPDPSLLVCIPRDSGAGGGG